MELVTGGELFERIVAQGVYTEEEASQIFKQILQCLGHMHSQGVIHRDLKPQNLLVAGDEQHLPGAPSILVKITDFGVSVALPSSLSGGVDSEPKSPSSSPFSSASVSDMAGTLSIMAPEVVRLGRYDATVHLHESMLQNPSSIGSYNHMADVWSAGCVLFMMLCGSMPFEDENHATMVEKICSASFQLPSNLSDSAKDLVTQLLQPDPSKRITIAEALEHPWFSSRPIHQLERNQSSLLVALPKIASFNAARRRWKTSVGAIIASRRLLRLSMEGERGEDAAASVTPVPASPPAATTTGQGGE